MTTQSSECFKSEHPDFAPGVWRLYGVIRGEPTGQNAGWGDRAPDGTLVRPYQADPGDPPWQTTANWKGYTATFQLGPDGRLMLVRFDYASPSLRPKLVNETLQGDFYAVFKASFEGPRLYVPFRDGTLVLDRDEWLHEESTDCLREDSPYQLGCHPAYPEAPEPSLEAAGSGHAGRSGGGLRTLEPVAARQPRAGHRLRSARRGGPALTPGRWR